MGRISGKQGLTICEVDLSHSQSLERLLRKREPVIKGGIQAESRRPPGRGVNEGLPDFLKGCSYGFYRSLPARVCESELKASAFPIRSPIRREMLNGIQQLDSMS